MKKKNIEDFRLTEGANKGRLNQQKLQTGNPKGTYKRGDKHPFVADLFFIGQRTSNNTERWVELPALLRKIATNKKWEAENKELKALINKKWGIKNKKHKADYNKNFRQSERGQEYFTNWWVENKEKQRIRRRKWYAKNREERAAYRKKHREENIESVRVRKRTDEAKRRAVKKEASVELTYAQEAMIRHYHEHASRLAEKLGIKFHVDHVVPLSKGGLHHPSNLQVVPAKWNLTKNNNNTDRWLPNGF